MRDMLGRGEAVSAEEALRLILENLPKSLPPEIKLELDGSYGRVLSRDVASPEDLPGFSRSTMDGYAVSAGDTFGAAEGSPAYLAVRHEIPMGGEPDFELKKGEAARISTGGMLPQGADAVLMLEHAQAVDDHTIEVQRAVAPGENVIDRGEDAKSGELILQRGRRLRPQDVAVLAGVGVTEVHVQEKPRVSIISTGDEVVPASSPLRPGQVRDMNSYSLAGFVMAEGGIPLRKGILKDDYLAIREACEGSLEDSDMVIITGGSSVGARDMTARIMEDLGRVLFHSVSMKPGKPMIAGTAGGTPVFGLPGHPRAVAVCFDAFVRPALALRAGMTTEAVEDMRRTVPARLAKSIRSSSGRQEYFSVALELSEGELLAIPLLGKSGLITMAVRAHGTVCVQAGRAGLDKGELVEVRLF
jgi:molybdopterin molybdotransferase